MMSAKVAPIFYAILFASARFGEFVFYLIMRTILSQTHPMKQYRVVSFATASITLLSVVIFIVLVRNKSNKRGQTEGY